MYVKGSDDATWRSDGKRLFRDIEPMSLKLLCPAEDASALGILRRRLSEEKRNVLEGTKYGHSPPQKKNKIRRRNARRETKRRQEACLKIRFHPAMSYC